MQLRQMQQEQQLQQLLQQQQEEELLLQHQQQQQLAYQQRQMAQQQQQQQQQQPLPSQQQQHITQQSPSQPLPSPQQYSHPQDMSQPQSPYAQQMAREQQLASYPPQPDSPAVMFGAGSKAEPALRPSEYQASAENGHNPIRPQAPAVQKKNYEEWMSTRLLPASGKEVLTWTRDEVASWAHNLVGISRRNAKVLHHKHITGEQLLNLSQTSLVHMGMTRGAAIDLDNAVEALIGTAERKRAEEITYDGGSPLWLVKLDLFKKVDVLRTVRERSLITTSTKCGSFLSLAIWPLVAAYTVIMVLTYLDNPFITNTTVRWTTHTGPLPVELNCRSLHGCLVANTYARTTECAKAVPPEQACMVLRANEKTTVSVCASSHVTDGVAVWFGDNAAQDWAYPPALGVSVMSQAADQDGEVMNIETPLHYGSVLLAYVHTANDTQSGDSRERHEWFPTPLAFDNLKGVAPLTCPALHASLSMPNLLKLTLDPRYTEIHVAKRSFWHIVAGVGGAHGLCFQVFSGLVLIYQLGWMWRQKRLWKQRGLTQR